MAACSDDGGGNPNPIAPTSPAAQQSAPDLPDFTRDHLQRLAAQQPQHHVPFPARAPPLAGRQGPRPNRRAVGADSAPCTLLD